MRNRKVLISFFLLIAAYSGYSQHGFVKTDTIRNVWMRHDRDSHHKDSTLGHVVKMWHKPHPTGPNITDKMAVEIDTVPYNKNWTRFNKKVKSFHR